MTQKQAPPPSTPYGPPIDLAAAKKAMAAAEADASKNGWGVAIAIVDSGGNLVMLERLDNAQLSSVRLAEEKALTAVEFRRPTKVLESAVAGGGIGLRALTFGASLAAACRSSWTAASSAALASRALPPSRMRRWRRPAPTRSVNVEANAAHSRISGNPGSRLQCQ